MKLTIRYIVVITSVIMWSLATIFGIHLLPHHYRLTLPLPPRGNKPFNCELKNDDNTKHQKIIQSTAVVTYIPTQQKERQSVLYEACSSLGFEETPPSTMPNFTQKQLSALKHTYVIDNLKLLYCYIPKVSCTNWKRMFLLSNGYFRSVDGIKNAHVEADRYFKKLSMLTTKNANHKLRKYSHFIFVRNPFSRILSAYREKIENRNPDTCYFSKYLTRWFKKTYPEVLHRNMTSGYTFPEFIRYVIARRVDNEHWNDQYQLCSPCTVKYDFIGKYETLQQDADYLLRTFTNDSTLKFPGPQKKPTHSSDDDVIREYYLQIPIHDLNALIECLYTDIRLFGYSIPDSVNRKGLALKLADLVR